jgi:hypothetical protein
MTKKFLKVIDNISILENLTRAEQIVVEGDVPRNLLETQKVVVKFQFPPTNDDNNNSFEVERGLHMMVTNEMSSKTSHLLIGLESDNIAITEFSKLPFNENETFQSAWAKLVQKQPEIMNSSDEFHQMSAIELQKNIRSNNKLLRLRQMQYFVVPQVTGFPLSEILQNNKYSKLLNDPDFSVHIAFQVAQVLCVFEEYKIRHNNLTLEHIFVEVLNEPTTIIETFPVAFQYQSQYRVTMTDFQYVGSEYFQNRNLSQEKCDSEGTCSTFVRFWDWYTFLTYFIGLLERKKADTTLLRAFYGGHNSPIKLNEYAVNVVNVKSDMDVGKACVCVESKTKKNPAGNVVVQCIRCKVDIDRLSLMKSPELFVQEYIGKVQQQDADLAQRKKIREEKQAAFKYPDRLSGLPQKQKLHVLERHLRFAQHDESREKKLTYQTEEQMVANERKERERQEREYRAISDDWDEERSAELEKREVRSRQQRRTDWPNDKRKRYNYQIKIYERNKKNGVSEENLKWMTPTAIEKRLTLLTEQKQADWAAFDQEKEENLRREASRKRISPEEIAKRLDLLKKQQELDLQAAAQAEKEKSEYEAAQNANRRSRVFASESQMDEFSNQIAKQKQLDDEAWLQNVLDNYKIYLEEKKELQEDTITHEEQPITHVEGVSPPTVVKIHSQKVNKPKEKEPPGLRSMTENDINEFSDNILTQKQRDDEAWVQKTLAEYDTWIAEKVESGERTADAETIRLMQMEIDKLVNFSFTQEQLQKLEATFAKQKQEMYLGEYDNLTCKNIQSARRFQDKFNQRFNVSWTDDMPAAAYYFVMQKIKKDVTSVGKDEYSYPMKLPENCRKKRTVYPYNLTSKQTHDLKTKLLDPDGFEVVSANYFNTGEIVVVQDDSSRDILKEAKKYISSGSEGHVYTLQQFQHNIKYNQLPIQLNIDSDITIEYFLKEMFPEHSYDFPLSEDADFYITTHEIQKDIDAKKTELEDRKSSMQVVRFVDLLQNTPRQYFMEPEPRPWYFAEIDKQDEIRKEQRLLRRIENARRMAQQAMDARIEARLKQEKEILNRENRYGEIDSETMKKKYQNRVKTITQEEYYTMEQTNNVTTLEQARQDEAKEQQENLDINISMATLTEKQILIKPELAKLFSSRHPYYQSQTPTDLVILFHKVQSQDDNDAETTKRIDEATKHQQNIIHRYGDDLIGETSAALYYFAHLDPTTYQLTDRDKQNCIQLEIQRLVRGSLDDKALIKLGITFTERKQHIHEYDQDTAQYFKHALKFQDIFNAKFQVPWTNDTVAAAYQLYLHELDNQKPFGELEEYEYPLKLPSNCRKKRTLYPYNLSSTEIQDLKDKILDPVGFKIVPATLFSTGEIVLIQDESLPHIIKQAKKYITSGSAGHVYTLSQFKHKLKYNMLPVQLKIDPKVKMTYVLNHWFPNKYDVLSSKEPDFYLVPDKKTKKLNPAVSILPLSAVIDDLNFYFYGTPTKRMTKKEVKYYMSQAQGN